MRKSSFFILISFIFIGFMSAQKITVTSPTASSIWTRGTSKQITWTKSGRMDSRIKIFLVNEAGVAKIIKKTDNDLIYKWNISSSGVGGRYRIRITTMDNKVTANSQVFRINKPPPSMSLPVNNKIEAGARLPANTGLLVEVVTPNGGEVMLRGERYVIRWNAVDGFNPPRIKILKGGRTVREYPPSEVVFNRTYRRNEYKWTWIIPMELTPGSDYKVRIEKGDFRSTKDLSDNNFTISSSPNIEVIAPMGGEQLIATHPMFVKWSSAGISSGEGILSTVNIFLNCPSSSSGSARRVGGGWAIGSYVPNSLGKLHWYVGNLPFKNYHSKKALIRSGGSFKIRVFIPNGSASGESDWFKIIKPTLEVLSPNGGHIRRGETLSIRWDNSPEFRGLVNIFLQIRSSLGTYGYEHFQDLFMNTRRKDISWRIPTNTDAPPTNIMFRIKVESVRCPNVVRAFGEPFRIVR